MKVSPFSMRIFCAVMLLSACALRPVYRDVVPTLLPNLKTVTLQVVERETLRPVEGATIESGEGKSRFFAMTDNNGLFVLPVDKKRFDENSVLLVSAAASHGRCQIREAPKVAPVEAAPADTSMEPDSGTGITP